MGKKMKKVIAIILISLLSLSACTQHTSSQTSETLQNTENPSDEAINLDELQSKYIDPLGLTAVIAQSWASPAELDPDNVLVTYEIKLLENREVFDKYANDDGNLHLPRDEAEAYSKQYFGMTPEQLRNANYYDGESQQYLVPIGLGGGWGVKVTSGEQNNNRLEIRYDLIDALDIINAKGVLDIQINSDGSYQYLSNAVHEEIYATLTFPAAEDFVLSEGKASMNSGGQVSMGQDDDNMTSYDGEDLSNIISFYEQALDKAGATGSADTTKYKDGWAWSGAYDNGKPLSVDIQPNTSGKGYKIDILF